VIALELTPLEFAALYGAVLSLIVVLPWARKRWHRRGS
jgi:hypothetical protein